MFAHVPIQYKKSLAALSPILILAWSLLFSSFEPSGKRLSCGPRDVLNECPSWRIISPSFNPSHLWTNLSFVRSSLVSNCLMLLLCSASVFDGHGLSRSQRRVSRVFFVKPCETKIHQERSTLWKTNYPTFILTEALVWFKYSYLAINIPPGTGFFVKSAENPIAPPARASRGP